MPEKKTQRRRRGRHIYDPAVVARLLAERRQSGETYSSLSARSGIPAATLSWHARRRKRGAESKFVEVVVTTAEPAPDLRVAVRSTAGDVEVIVPAGFDADDLRRLVGALEQRC